MATVRSNNVPKVAVAATSGGKRLTFKRSVRMKRVSFYVPEQLYDDIQAFADDRGDTVAGVLRWSLGVGKVIWDDIKGGRIIRSTDSNNSTAGHHRELIFGRF